MRPTAAARAANLDHYMRCLTTSALVLVQSMRGRKISPVEVIQSRLDRIEAVNPILNAVVTLRAEEALAEAKKAERAYGRRRPTARALEGIPFTVKDTIETAAIRTTAGSNLLARNVPAFDATAVARLRSAGAIVLGKTNTPEFAMTFATENSLFGKTLNPWDLSLTTGGSSGGEAAIIAAGGSICGLGSDLAGSIRIPAFFCGISGLRPTAGRVASDGHIPDLPEPLARLCVIGPMARRPLDIGLLMGSLAPDWQPWDAPLKSHLHVAFFDEIEGVPTTTSTKHAISSAAALLKDDGKVVDSVRRHCHHTLRNSPDYGTSCGPRRAEPRPPGTLQAGRS